MNTNHNNNIIDKLTLQEEELNTDQYINHERNTSKGNQDREDMRSRPDQRQLKSYEEGINNNAGIIA